MTRSEAMEETRLTNEFNFSSRSAHSCEFLDGLATPAGCSPGFEDAGQGGPGWPWQHGWGGGTEDRVLLRIQFGYNE